MSISANWIFPIGLGILSTVIVFLMQRPKPVLIRIKANRRRK